jgi:hypothetical protein
MIGRLLCGIGIHAWRNKTVRALPTTPLFDRPAFIELECRRCRKTDWTFRS